LNCGGALELYELNKNWYFGRMVMFCSGVIVAAAGFFWLKIARPAWHDFDQARKPHLPRSP
jgi:hypothetical protein